MSGNIAVVRTLAARVLTAVWSLAVVLVSAGVVAGPSAAGASPARVTDASSNSSENVSCQRDASLREITIHGNYLGLYQDYASTLIGENYSPGGHERRCDPAWYLTGPTGNISIDGVTSYGGPGLIAGPATDVTVSNQVVVGSGCGP